MRASVQAVSSILGIPANEIVALIERKQIKARRFRTQATIDVMHPFDEYVIDYDSALAYQQTIKNRRKESAPHIDAPSGEKVLDITRRGSR